MIEAPIEEIYRIMTQKGQDILCHYIHLFYVYIFESMLINKILLDELTEKAKVNPRLRMNYDLRDSSEDESQRMLNAIEPGEWHGHHRGQEYEV